MIILMANQKGGVGKSTLTILLANYFSSKGQEIHIIDLDNQQSVNDIYNKSIEQGWSNPLITCEKESKLPRLNSNRYKQKLILIDLPGRLDNQQLKTLLKQADIIVCPFLFDPISFKSTLVFAQLCQFLAPDGKIFFLPNRIKSTVKEQNEGPIRKILLQFGELLPRIPDLVCFQRVSSFSTTQEQVQKSKNAFDFLYHSIQ
ncbi:ParA family protein [Persicobacter diffluens]|uniref:Chromosome partitioning protein ParA n=1 Tax=Persicobacter diffluens TaxID=981 RepID=A0AAN4W2T3_9BACT|nr:chromosome partitioning protein ParA [Persicobacter diffluens]